MQARHNLMTTPLLVTNTFVPFYRVKQLHHAGFRQRQVYIANVSMVI